MLHSRIFLIGPMGAGKSAVGRRLAEMLGLDFVDADNEIMARTGVDISYIFEKEGESGFRKREGKMIDELTQRDNIVLATGGGATVAEENRNYLGGRGTVIYLRASIAQQLARVRHSHDRPMLRTGEPEDVLRELFEIREPTYQSIADYVIETDGQRVAAVASNIRDALSAMP